jgi:hypothetical protein|tara:strand:+ start:19116 stop:19493 length:378 start_codon:yes stop_codon:yes gene_type:complete
MNEEKNILIINGEEFEVDGENIIINSDSNGSRISVNGMPIKNYPELKLAIEFKGDLASITSYARTTVNGDVNGNIKASEVKCENVEGNINSDNVTCKDITGNITGKMIRCNNVSGDIDADVVKKS